MTQHAINYGNRHMVSITTIKFNENYLIVNYTNKVNVYFAMRVSNGVWLVNQLVQITQIIVHWHAVRWWGFRLVIVVKDEYEFGITIHHAFQSRNVMFILILSLNSNWCSECLKYKKCQISIAIANSFIQKFFAEDLYYAKHVLYYSLFVASHHIKLMFDPLV